MDEAQINEAIEQMKTHCELKMVNYEPISARSCLYELGYHGEDTEQVLQRIYDGGFTVCLDSHFKSQGVYPDFTPEYPSPDVCYWGPDQLKSRLDSLFYMKG
jgi:hypothetical protein